ncbi:hypothetical protein JHK85_000012 [Glycine max]|nr:hypothetical protein JHK85_000012 [Glycine max]KAG5087399.1 hypothetical protein JHK86_000011 [Glycine max]
MLFVLYLLSTLTIKPVPPPHLCQTRATRRWCCRHHCDGLPLSLMGIQDEEQEREGERSTAVRSHLAALVGAIDCSCETLRDCSSSQALEGEVVFRSKKIEREEKIGARNPLFLVAMVVCNREEERKRKGKETWLP